MSRRRRALLLGGLALVLGGLAAFNVAGREAALERRVGGLVDVVVARERIAAGDRVRAARARGPQRARALRAAGDERPAAGVRRPARGRRHPGRGRPERRHDRPRGRAAGRAAVDRGERVAEIVALGSAEVVVPGSRVDVLVTPEPSQGAPGVAVLALEDVEVIAAPAVADDVAPVRQGRARARAWPPRCA